MNEKIHILNEGRFVQEVYRLWPQSLQAQGPKIDIFKW